MATVRKPIGKANRERGEASFFVERDGVQKEYILKMSINAAAALQQQRGKYLPEIMAGIETLDFLAMRDIAWLFLQKHHADEIDTVEKAGDLIDEAGGIDAFFTAFNQLMQDNQPPADGAAANPRRAQTASQASSTSDVSSSTPVASV